MRDTLRKELELPEKTAFTKTDSIIRIAGPEGEAEKRLASPNIRIFSEGNKIILESKKATKKEKKTLNAFHAHLKNMLRGVAEKHVYLLRICSGHFPMNVSVSGDQLLVKNFLGESVPRKLTIKPGAEVKVEGNEVIVSSSSKETAGQVAADIELLTRIKNRDLRIFQDGIWIISKGGKEV